VAHCRPTRVGSHAHDAAHSHSDDLRDRTVRRNRPRSVQIVQLAVNLGNIRKLDVSGHRDYQAGDPNEYNMLLTDVMPARCLSNSDSAVARTSLGGESYERDERAIITTSSHTWGWHVPYRQDCAQLPHRANPHPVVAFSTRPGIALIWRTEAWAPRSQVPQASTESARITARKAAFESDVSLLRLSPQKSLLCLTHGTAPNSLFDSLTMFAPMTSKTSAEAAKRTSRQGARERVLRIAQEVSRRPVEGSTQWAWQSKPGAVSGVLSDFAHVQVFPPAPSIGGQSETVATLLRGDTRTPAITVLLDRVGSDSARASRTAMGVRQCRRTARRAAALALSGVSEAEPAAYRPLSTTRPVERRALEPRPCFSGALSDFGVRPS
jgi:hypothetical protein